MPDLRRPKAIPNSPEFTADFADGADEEYHFPKPPTMLLNEHLRAPGAFSRLIAGWPRGGA